jgi:hypothetical protein
VIGFLYHWFDFPDGSVLTNLIASAVCVGLAGWKILAKMRDHAEAMHMHLDDVHAHVKLIHEHQLAHTPKRQTR